MWILNSSNIYNFCLKKSNTNIFYGTAKDIHYYQHNCSFREMASKPLWGLWESRRRTCKCMIATPGVRHFQVENEHCNCCYGMCTERGSSRCVSSIWSKHFQEQAKIWSFKGGKLYILSISKILFPGCPRENVSNKGKHAPCCHLSCVICCSVLYQDFTGFVFLVNICW